jgi:tetratricopeptide (TPR) repeat protein
MSKKTTENLTDQNVETAKPIPENLPEELLPLYDWWKAKGAQSLLTAGAVAVIAISALAYMHYRKTRNVEANIQLTNANSLEELETAVAEYGDLPAGNALRLRLAKTYYDAAKYEEALQTYDECAAAGPPEGFEDIVTLGRAHSLEALEQNDAALEIFRNFAEDCKESFLYPQAVMGMARVMTMQNRKQEAKHLLEELKAEKSDEPIWEMAIANLEDVIDRYEPRSKPSLFDMAESAEKQLQQEEVPASPATVQSGEE